jgi:hypothetical protein
VLKTVVRSRTGFIALLEPEPYQFLFSEAAEPELHQYDTAPQHCLKIRPTIRPKKPSTFFVLGAPKF